MKYACASFLHNSSLFANNDIDQILSALKPTYMLRRKSQDRAKAAEFKGHAGPGLVKILKRGRGW